MNSFKQRRGKVQTPPPELGTGQTDRGEAGSGIKDILQSFLRRRGQSHSRPGPAGLAVIGQPGWRLQTVSQRQSAQRGSARVLGLLIGQRGLSLGPPLQASGVDLADLFQGAGESVEVGGVLMASLPQAEDDGRRTPLLRKVAQVPKRSTERRSADPPLAC